LLPKKKFLNRYKFLETQKLFLKNSYQTSKAQFSKEIFEYIGYFLQNCFILYVKLLKMVLQ
jgi:hypothetical protein